MASPPRPTQPDSRGRKPRISPRAGTAVIWPAGLMEMLDISEPTLFRWRRKKLIPPPDVQIGNRKGWRPETIERVMRGEKPQEVA